MAPLKGSVASGKSGPSPKHQDQLRAQRSVTSIGYLYFLTAILATELWDWSWSWCTGSHPQLTFLSHPPAVSCDYFPPGLQSIRSQRASPFFVCTKLYWLLGDKTYIGVNNLPKVVTQLCPGGNWTHDPLIGNPIQMQMQTTYISTRSVVLPHYQTTLTSLCIGSVFLAWHHSAYILPPVVTLHSALNVSELDDKNM